MLPALLLLSGTLCAQVTASESDSVLVEAIRIRGNKKTKAYVIQRELMFRAGERYATEEVPERLNISWTQLNNTSLFGEISVRDSAVRESVMILLVDLTERWYFFPAPVFELADRNINVWLKQFNADVNRINFGVSPKFKNLTGNYDDLKATLQWGFTPKIEIEYRRPYVAQSPNNGLAVFGSYSVNRQVPYINQGDKELFLDLENFSLTRFRLLGQYLRRNGVYQFHTAEIKYSYNSIADTVFAVNPDFFLGGRQQQQFITLSYWYLYNKVDQKAYPLRGVYSEFNARKIGLGIFGDLNQWTFTAKHNQYFGLPFDFYGGVQVIGKTALGKEHPYFNLEGLGFCQDIVRGYELYAIDGQHYALFKSNFKHRLFGFNIPNPLKKADSYSGIPLEVFIKAYGDVGYVSDRFYTDNNPLTNTPLLGGGIGLDIVTFYDWVFRVEYSFNRLGENGLFLHASLDLDTYEDCNLW